MISTSMVVRWDRRPAGQDWHRPAGRRSHRRYFWAHFSLLAICAILCGPTAIHAQRVRPEPEVVTKTSPQFRAAFREAIAAPARSTVRVRCDDKETALGAVVGADGWVL